MKQDFVGFVSQQIALFLSLNKTPCIAASLLGETLKAYIRGEIISYAGFDDKLSHQIAKLDNMNAISFSQILQERPLLPYKLDILITNHVSEKLARLRSGFFEHSDKVNKLLAHQLCQNILSSQVSQIRSPSWITYDPQEINYEF